MTKPFSDCGFYAEYGPLATATFAGDGTLYVAFVASDFLNRVRNSTPRHVFLARSSDSGRTFTTSRVFDAPDGNQDRGLNKGPMLAVDPGNPQRVYVGWRQGVFAADAKEKLKSNVAASLDGGRTFGAPVDLTDDRGADFPALAVDRRHRSRCVLGADRAWCAWHPGARSADRVSAVNRSWQDMVRPGRRRSGQRRRGAPAGAGRRPQDLRSLPGVERQP